MEYISDSPQDRVYPHTRGKRGRNRNNRSTSSSEKSTEKAENKEYDFLVEKKVVV